MSMSSSLDKSWVSLDHYHGTSKKHKAEKLQLYSLRLKSKPEVSFCECEKESIGNSMALKRNVLVIVWLWKEMYWYSYQS